MNRREFLKGTGLTALGMFAASKIPQNLDLYSKELSNIEFYEEGTYELISYATILAATNEFAGKTYSWNKENHHCSGYVAQYFKYLGFSIGLVTTPVSEYSPNINDPMPNSTTVKQVPYLKMIAKEYGKDLATQIPLKVMLSDEKIWQNIPPGTVLYLPERVGHHGYDTFTHTAIFMGLDKEQAPLFSEFSSYMKSGPQYGHGFEQFSRMYKNQNIEPYNKQNGELMVFMFDAVKASRRVFNKTMGKEYPLFQNNTSQITTSFKPVNPQER